MRRQSKTTEIPNLAGIYELSYDYVAVTWELRYLFCNHLSIIMIGWN